MARTEGLCILGAYFPQRRAKADFFSHCVELVSEEAGPLLLIGDLNTGSNTLDIEPGGARFHCEHDFLELSSKHGLVDLWRHRHGEDRREWTWRSSGTGSGLTMRLGLGPFFRPSRTFAARLIIRRVKVASLITVL
ncbi:MAG: hypothetical protein R3F08_11040 [Dokdonella sp.]